MGNASRLQTTSRIRRIYDLRPYPIADKSALDVERWFTIPMEWVDALWQPSRKSRNVRILVAGCGAGSEAFALQQRFPKARIIGVDLSPRSIGVARELQRISPKM